MITKKLFLSFPKSVTEKPIVYHMVKDFNLIINIFRARVTPEEEGYIVLDVTGEKENIERGMDYVRSFNITIDEARKGVLWDQSKCTHCGKCVAHCPTKALYVADRNTMRIDFDSNLCVECLNCLKICPFNACSSRF